jgi:surfactin synthase thioesterase subunit
LQLWENHTAGAFELDWYDGGHFYVDDHADDIAARVNADG